MFLNNSDNRKRFDAYTLAEVLIVMVIIMIIFLAMPVITKKTFRIKTGNKTHGRFECYWKTDASGTKHLYSYQGDEKGRSIEKQMPDGQNYCTFVPMAGSLYYMIYAVGGGGAGALIPNDKSDLASPEDVYVESNLNTADVNAWPDWVNWFANVTSCSNIPWTRKDSVSSQTCSNKARIRGLFDVGRAYRRQKFLYRYSGNAGTVISSFIPQLPSGAELRLYPGQGGTLARPRDSAAADTDDFKNGIAGKASKIKYLYKDGTEIEGLSASGGSGGSESSSFKYFDLAGGYSTDFGMSTIKAVATKLANFYDVIEPNSSLIPSMKTKVPEGAGNGGSGETQFVTSNSGGFFYRGDTMSKCSSPDGCFYGTQKLRYGTNWKEITSYMGFGFYTEKNISSDGNCEEKTVSSSSSWTGLDKIAREGYCIKVPSDKWANSYNAYNATGGSHYEFLRCAVGDIPNKFVLKYVLGEISDYKYGQDETFKEIVAAPTPTNPSATTEETTPKSGSDDLTNFMMFRVRYNVESDGGKHLVEVVPEGVDATYNGYGSFNDDTRLVGDYNHDLTRFYMCGDVDFETGHITCLEQRPVGAKYHWCTHKSSSSYKCSNGESVMKSSDSANYTTGTTYNKLKCPGHDGGDGAIVILW